MRNIKLEVGKTMLTVIANSLEAKQKTWIAHDSIQSFT